jgi:protein-tyrosine phosphatase
MTEATKADFSEVQPNLWQGGLNRSSLVVGLVLLRSGTKFNEVINLIRSQRGEHSLSNRQFYEYLEGRRRA